MQILFPEYIDRFRLMIVVDIIVIDKTYMGFSKSVPTNRLYAVEA